MTASLALLAGLSTTLAACTRDALLASAETYVEAIRTGKTDGLKLNTGNFTYRENNKVVDLGKGVLGSTALTLDANRSTADTVACASYTMLISAGGSKPYVLATQVRHDTGDPSVITMIDVIAATTGSLFFNAKQTLGYINAESWTPLATADQPSRDLLKKVGDAYLDMWTDKNAADTIPWGTQCERVEGSRLTKPCGASLPHGGSAQPNAMRRYVIDEVMGSVDVLCAFNSLGNMPDSHEIRVEGGKVKYVHTITV
ncbi:H/ACA snoRNP pseudouridylase subunit [Sporothrix eucalyptigena]